MWSFSGFEINMIFSFSEMTGINFGEKQKNPRDLHGP
jgi:hypothetical protein